MFDVVIKDVNIIDGNNRPAFKGEIGINKGKIAIIDQTESLRGQQEINGEGLTLAPGFIDLHTHSDLAIFENNLTAKLQQGITTEVVGNCGFSPAPISDDKAQQAEEFLKSVLGTSHRYQYTDIAEYFAKADKTKLLMNVAPLLGHGSLRLNTMGFDSNKASLEQRKELAKTLALNLAQGAWGLSTGLIYAPGCYSDLEELQALCKVAKAEDVPYITHIRSEASSIVEAVTETIELGLQTNVSLHFSHHQIDGQKNWGKSKTTIKLMEQARNKGLKITMDQYPYLAGSTVLSALLPKWVLEGGRNKTLERLVNKDCRASIKRDFAENTEELLINETGWENVMLNSLSIEKQWEQKTLKQLAELKKQDPLTAFLDLFIDVEGDGTVVLFDQSEEDWRRIFLDPFCSIASDSILVGEKPHPRSFGTFPYVLGEICRGQKIISLTEAIHKMTALPAATLGLKQVGRIKEGFYADLILFDPQTIGHQGDFASPNLKPQGIELILIQGEIVLKQGQVLGKKLGRALRRYR